MERDSIEYGDFQTPPELARRICRWLQAKGIRPEVLVEPTFGQGHFIRAALDAFPSIRHVYGVEIHEPYFEHMRQQLKDENRTIRLHCADVFRFSFAEIAKQHADQFVLVLGNPPWVTNSRLGKMGSGNLPRKFNAKNAPGIEALTGQGNFDLGESVALALLKDFATSNGCFAFLVKNSVVKNVVLAQRRFRFPIGGMERISVDAKKEFNAAVDASLFFARFREEPGRECTVFDSFDSPPVSRFGWCGDKFVSDLEKYEKTAFLDGICPGIWRQGIKHDCAKVMELILDQGVYRNGFGECVDVEDNLIFPLFKSSDLREPILGPSRKFVIVPQKFLGQNTDELLEKCPKTAAYLNRHRESFERRKSSIYRNKPPFSIFGVGEYSFKPYKIAISGLYKRTFFSLVSPQTGKPVMLDDTCYSLGFDSSEEAARVHHLLNGEKMQDLLRSLVFMEGKRVITKEILMRLDYERSITTAVP